MVCLGNICRSPLAEGIMKAHIKEQGLDWQVDSAGTSSWHIGESPDPRSISIARENGLDITDQRGRQFIKDDFDRFDLILTMDASNYQNVLNLARSDADRQKVKLILNYLYPDENRTVPDPYYDNGFPRVYEMLNEACRKIIDHHAPVIG